MNASVTAAHLRPSQSPAESWLSSGIFLLVVVWFALVFLLAAAGAFVRPPGSPPLGLLVALFVPLLAFLGSHWWSQAFRELVLTADLQLLTGIQAWRFAGLAFIALYAQGILPGYFAWPAGLGDIAIGLTAPWIVRALRRDASFGASRPFLIWNLLGILDLVVAISMGAIVSLVLTASPLGRPAHLVSTAPMTHLPLVLVPTFFVPLLLILHLVVLFQRSRLTTREEAR